jgi:hypothetical protein
MLAMRAGRIETLPQLPREKDRPVFARHISTRGNHHA